MRVKTRKVVVKSGFGEDSFLGDSSLRSPKERPLSPHIQIYKWQWTMIYSILHRLSALGVGFIAVAFCVIIPHRAAVYLFLTKRPYIHVTAIFFVFLAVVSVAYYVFATAKYMLWSKGKGMTLDAARRWGNVSVLCTIVATLGVFLWYHW